MIKPILHLNLKRKWFDMIKSGEKTVEYRALSPYWKQRLWKYYAESVDVDAIIICFSNGYAKNRPQFYADLKDITVGIGRPEWGAVPKEKYFCLHLGKISTCDGYCE